MQLGDQEMTVFDDKDPEMTDFTMDDSEYSGNSFKSKYATKMNFLTDFLSDMSKRPDGFVVRHDFDKESDVMDLIRVPEFYDHLGNFMKFQLTMG